VWVDGDAVRLEQVVVNLLNNAVKYTDRGGDIRVALNQEGEEAVLRVRDNGIGIAPDMLPRIFDLFMQADKSLDRAQGGLGIGLALVHSIVTMHRGQVEVQSHLGEGSEFIIKLPLILSPSQVPVVAVTDVAPQTVRSLKVLVVDDNIDAARSVAMLLRISGQDSRLAHDGGSAMKTALDYVPDVVLLDIGLPVADGFQVAKWIRQQDALQNVVLVALTGYGRETDRQLSREAGFDHHLVKPVEMANIESILSNVAMNIH
jgi:CheY-like chemotaxis protein